MKTYGGIDVYIHAYLRFALIEVNGQLYSPAASSKGKFPPAVPIRQRPDSRGVRLDAVKGTKSPVLAENRTARS
jgi:hypothetical protein